MSIIDFNPDHPNKPQWFSEKRLYLNSKGEVCDGDDRDKQSLLVAAGCSIPLERAKALGLVVPMTPPTAADFVAAGEQGNGLLDHVREHQEDPEETYAEMIANDSIDLGEVERDIREYFDPFAGLTGLGDELKAALIAAGIESAAAMQSASDDDLLAVSGIGKAKLKSLREQLEVKE